MICRSAVGFSSISRAVAALLAGRAATAPLAAAPLTVDRVVMVMRHGVRPPTKDPALPVAVTSGRWPGWPVGKGELTPHGAAAVTALGRDHRRALVTAGVLPATGCPAAGAVTIVADSDQRTIATAEAWAAGVAPGCAVADRHRPQGGDDPTFSPVGAGVTLDPAAVDAGVAAAVGPGGIAAVEAAHAPLLARLDAILCPPAATTCGVRHEAIRLIPARPDARPRLSGALDRGSTAAQVLLLEYAEGKPLAEVGWGRASAADVTALSALHALEFRLLARPRPLAKANLALLLPTITAALTDAVAAAVTLISGHDTEVANLAGLLDVHWHVAGFAPDDPAPGGAIVIERLHDAAGARFVRVSYRAQTLDQLRSGGEGAAAREVLTAPGCMALGDAGLCTAAQFRSALTR